MLKNAINAFRSTSAIQVGKCNRAQSLESRNKSEKKLEERGRRKHIFCANLLISLCSIFVFFVLLNLNTIAFVCFARIFTFFYSRWMSSFWNLILVTINNGFWAFIRMKISQTHYDSSVKNTFLFRGIHLCQE